MSVSNSNVVEGGAGCELEAEVLLRLEDEGGARDWSLVKMAMEEEVDTGSIDEEGVGTTLVSE